MATIREWMNNKTILMTGGAGFMGKVLVEKLLRACPGVKRIYIVIRPKRNQTPQERWNEIIKDELFKMLLTNTPDIMDQKVTILDGDMSLIDLGLSPETIEELKKNVNIIFHIAATVRFNDPLHKALLTNTRGTLEMCKLATEMSKLEVFVHVSTAFCNQNLNTSYYTEKVYEPCQDWKILLKLLEEENPTVLNTISYKIIQDHPNTYTFTKSLSEKIVEDYSCKFPAVIARPPVVLGLLDPLPGWTDNLNGLIGITTGVCKGVIRVIKADEKVTLSCTTADIAINAIIICGWDKAISENKELSVYNCTDADFVPISFHDLTTDGPEINNKDCALDNDVWYPFIISAKNDYYFCTLFYLLQVIPAILVDSVMAMMKSEKRLMKITIKIYQALRALESFMIRQVTFESKQYRALWGKLTPEEAEIFNVKVSVYVKTIREAMLTMHKGVKQYILKENVEEADYYKTKLTRFYYLHQVTKGILIGTLFVIVYKCANMVVHKFIL